MASITGTGIGSQVDLYSSSTTPLGAYQVGEFIFGANGKGFRHVLAGGSALVVGNLLQESAQDTQFENMAVTATSINTNGIQTLNITNGTTTVTDNAFRGGSISVYTAGGEAIGYEYTILGVTGTLTSGGAMVVAVDHPIGTAWTTSLKVNMKRSPWSGVIQFPATTQTGIPVGVAIYPIAAGEYGWVQTKGVCGVLSDGSTFAVGSDLGTPSGTAGAVTVFAAGTTHARVGVSRQAAAAAHAISALLQID